MMKPQITDTPSIQIPSISDQNIVSSLINGYGIDVIALEQLSLGADMTASVFKAEDKDHSLFFVKIKKGFQPEISFDIMNLLVDSEVQQIIPPIRTIQGQQVQRMVDFTLAVYPFVQGQDGFRQDLTEAQWILLGKAFRQVHSLEVPISLQSRIRRETYSSKWREAVRAIYAKIDTDLYQDALASRVATFLKENRARILRLVDRSDQLAVKLGGTPVEYVLCHSDIHGGNVLVDGSGAIYIVDWDDPILAPKERDLMFIGGGVGKVWNKPSEEEKFYKGYGLTQVDASILSYYRHERIVEDIALYAQELLFGASTNTGRSTMYKHFNEMFEPGDVVDIAFKTDVN